MDHVLTTSPFSSWIESTPEDLIPPHMDGRTNRPRIRPNRTDGAPRERKLVYEIRVKRETSSSEPGYQITAGYCATFTYAFLQDLGIPVRRQVFSASRNDG